jgi:hypothetical protein
LAVSRRLVFVKSGAFAGTLPQARAHARAGELQAVRVVDEPVENGVGNRRVGEHFVPVLHVDLAGDDRRTAPLPIVEDLQQIAALVRRDVSEPPVVEDQQRRAGDGLEQPCVPAVAARQRQRVEQPWHTVVENRAIVPARLVAKGTCQPTFAEPGFADDDQILVLIDPVAGGETREQRFIEAARRFHVDVFDHGALAQGDLGDRCREVALITMRVRRPDLNS